VISVQWSEKTAWRATSQIEQRILTAREGYGKT
jgi:hypothetical protein